MLRVTCEHCHNDTSNDYIHKKGFDYCPKCYILLTDKSIIVTFIDGKLIDVSHLY